MRCSICGSHEHESTTAGCPKQMGRRVFTANDAGVVIMEQNRIIKIIDEMIERMDKELQDRGYRINPENSNRVASMNVLGDLKGKIREC